MLGRGRKEQASFALKRNKTNTLTSSFRATGWGLDRDLRGLRPPLLPPSTLILNLKGGEGDYLVQEGKRTPYLCEPEKTGIDIQ